MNPHPSQRGFSLIEMLIVVAVLSVVMGAIFNTLIDGMKKYKTVESRVTVTQESRAFLDQIVRDLHSSGYPNIRMFNSTALGSPPYNSSLVAQGLVAVSATDIWFEGDVDNSGNVQSIRYTLQADANGNCPCTMMRGVTLKVNGVAPASQSVTYNTQLQNVINSTGGANPYAIAGTTTFSSTTVSNDTLYGTYKAVPVFAFYDQNGNAVTVPPDLQGANLATGQTAAASVHMISVNLNLLSADQDLQTKLRPSISMRAMVKMNNL